MKKETIKTQTTNEIKTLKEELKSITQKIDTKNKERHRIAAKKSREKQLALAAKNKVVVAPVVKKSNAKNVDVKKVASNVKDEPKTIEILAKTEGFICTLKMVLNDGTKLRVVKKNNNWYCIKETKNIFGSNIEIMSEHKDSGTAERALHKKLGEIIA
jgi:hypothetical protein